MVFHQPVGDITSYIQFKYCSGSESLHLHLFRFYCSSFILFKKKLHPKQELRSQEVEDVLLYKVGHCVTTHWMLFIYSASAQSNLICIKF